MASEESTPKSSTASSSGAPQESSASRSRLSRMLRFVVIQAVVVSCILFCIELALSVAGVELEPMLSPRAAYPERPEDYIKVAVFGGSSAEGTYNPCGFDEMLSEELQRRSSEKPWFVHNFASHGEPFHRYQAEYAKRLVSRYDVMVIYCGNNEAENYYDDSGYWRQPEYQDQKDLVFSPPIEAARWPKLASAIAWLRGNSRICALGTQWKTSQAPVTKNRNYDYQEFEDRLSLPSEELTAIGEGFESDLRGICELGRETKTQVLIAPVTIHGNWPPAFSVLPTSLTQDERDAWMRHLQQGRALYEEGESSSAMNEYDKAADLASDVAILQFERGRAARKLGMHAKAHSLARQAVDLEGHYFRCHSVLHERAAKVANQFPNAHYLDLRVKNANLIEAGVEEDELYTDICHPSFLGYTVIADAMATAICQQLGIEVAELGEANNTADWTTRSKELYQALAIRPVDHRRSYAENILYCFDLMHFTAYPDRCETQIGKLLAAMDSLGEQDPLTEVFGSVSRARLALRHSDREAAIDFLNTALEVSPVHVERIFDLKAWNHYVADEFSEAEIRYSREERKFVAR